MRILKRVLRTLRNLFLLVLAFAVGAVLVLTLTEKGRENLAGVIADQASTSDRRVRLGGVSGIWNGQLRIDHVVVEDSVGPWLVLRGVEVDWSPLRLLRRRFEAERVHASRVEIARLPELGESTSDSSGFDLPVAVAIQKIDLPEIALGEALAGSGVAELAADGSVFAETGPLVVDAKLNVRRTDGVAGTLAADIVFQPEQNRLQLDVDASEPAGGIIANLLQLPGDPAVGIRISGSGPAADWTGKGSFSVDGAVVASVEGTHRLTETGSAITARGSGDFSRFAPEKVRSLIAGATDFDVAGTFAGGAFSLERATVRSATLNAEASGSINLAGANDFSLQVAANQGAVPLSLGTETQPIDLAVRSITARVFGDGRQPMLDLTASLASLDAGLMSASDLEATVHSDAFDLQSLTGPVAVDLKATAVQSSDERLAPLLAGPVAVKASGEVGTDAVTIGDGSISTAAVTANVTGTVARSGATFALDVKGDVAASALPEGARVALGDRVAVAGSVSRDAAGAIILTGLDLKSGELQAAGDLSLAGDDLTADLSGAFGDVGRFASQASGAVQFDLKASGARGAPDLSLSITSADLAVASRRITDLKVEATGRADLARPTASVSVSGLVGEQRLQGSAVLQTDGGQRTVRDLLLTLGENKIAGDLTLDADFVPLGTVSLTLPDIGPLAALALESVEGDVNGTVRFTREDGRPQVAVAATAASVTRDTLSAKGVAAELTVADYFAAPTVSGTVRADSLTAGGTVVRSLDVRLTRDGEWTGFDGGATVSDIPARASGRVRVSGGATTVELNTGRATFRGIEASLVRPTTVRVANGTATLDRAALNVGGGTVTVSGTAGSALALDIRLNAVPAAVANNFVPGLGAAGAVSGTVKVTGTPAQPVVAYDVDWSGARVAQTTGAGLGALTVRSTGNFAGGRLTFNADVREGSGITLRGGGSVMTTGNRALDLAFNGTLPFSFLSGRLGAQGMALTGNANADITVRGTTTAPVIGGTVRSSGARFVDVRSGIAVNDIAADIALGNGRATINRLTGSMAGGGSVSATGTVGIAAGSRFPADLRVQLRNARYTDGQVVTTTVNGDLTVTGSLVSSPRLGGVINLGRTVIAIPDRLPSSLAELDVQHRNAPAAVIAQHEAIQPPSAREGGSTGIILDIQVNAPQQIFVQGRGLDAELGGSVRLSGPTSDPRAVGQFTLRRGRLNLLSRQLTFSRGNIGFSGSLVPYLDFAADSTSNGTTATVAVTGPANNPRFTFSSVPALPEDEILAQLLFGRSLTRLSPLQIAQLADAAAQLAGVGGTSSLLQTLQGRLGVDDLNVVTDEKGRTAVTAGKYLNDRTYVTIEAGGSAGSSRATIDLDVGRGVKLRGSAASDGEAKGGIFFEREY